MQTPISDRHIKESFPRFIEEMRQALETGKVTYGDNSFLCDADKIFDEIQGELRDNADWSFIQWCKIEELRRLMAEAISAKKN